MALIKCPECGYEYEGEMTSCPECGYVFKQDKNEKTLSIITTSFKKFNINKLIAGILLATGILCLIFALVFGIKANDVKNNYYNSEYSSTLNQNAYVGGDAYNFIINGTYFTGFAVMSSGFLVGGIILVVSSIKYFTESKNAMVENNNEDRKINSVNND